LRRLGRSRPLEERITAFDRRGEELSLTVVDAEPPVESLPE